MSVPIELPAPTCVNLVLCSDCTMAAVNDDYTGLDYHYQEPEATERMEAIQTGLRRLGPGLSPMSWLGDPLEDEISRENATAVGQNWPVAGFILSSTRR